MVKILWEADQLPMAEVASMRRTNPSRSGAAAGAQIFTASIAPDVLRRDIRCGCSPTVEQPTLPLLGFRGASQTL